MKPIKTNTTAKSKTIEAIVSGGMLYYIPKNKNQVSEEKRYFLEWKNRLIKFWEDKGNLEMQKEMEALTIRNYRNDVKRVFQNYKEIENNPILKKELKEYQKVNLILQKLLMATTTGDYRNAVKRIFQRYKLENYTGLKEVVEENFQLREKIENNPILKEKYERFIKAYRVSIKKLIATNYGDLQSVTENLTRVSKDILNSIFLKDSELEMQKLVKALAIGDYRNEIKRFFQNHKEIIENNPNIKETVENFIKFREKAENDPILKEKFKRFAKESKVFLKKEYAANSEILPATEDLIKGIYDIMNRTLFKDSELEIQELVKALTIGDYRKLFQNYKEKIENNPILKNLVENYIKFREKAENDPILKEKLKRFAKESRVFLKKEYAVNSETLPATEDLTRGMYDIMNSIFLKDSELEKTQPKKKKKRKNGNV